MMKYAALGLAFALATGTGAPSEAQTPTTAPPVTPRLFGVKLAVRDFALTTKFYTLLGMQEGPHHNEWEWELKWDDPARGSSIIMVRDDQSQRFHVVRGADMLIISSPDVYAALARLRAAGFAVPAEPKITPVSATAMIQDPDGNWIEFAGPRPKDAH